jgi:site-specific DNA-methyltransferase (adenine-specific)
MTVEIIEYKKHPYNIFPEMVEEEFSSLLQDIHVSGFSNESFITLFEGKVLDGWNRYRACQRLGVKPNFKEFSGSSADAIHFVMRTNKRRNLTSSQWAALSVESEEIIEKLAAEAKERKNQTTKLERNEKGQLKPVPQIFGELETDESESKHDNESEQQVAETFNTNRQYVSDAKKIKEQAPDLLAHVKDGTLAIANATKLLKADEDTREAVIEKVKAGKKFTEATRLVKEKRRKEAIENNKPSTDYNPNIYLADIRDGLPFIKDESVDIIITDPPYPKEFLPLFSDLSRVASRVLKTGGLCVVMSGQTFLPEVFSRLCEHLTYHWTGAYLTPGGQAVQIFPRKVNTFWKPLLIFSKGEYQGDWFGDVTKSNTNDNDKRFHEWGQSESGMADVIKRFSRPGQTLLDPFCGGGTTGIVALANGLNFIGVDIDQKHVDISTERLCRVAQEYAA